MYNYVCMQVNDESMVCACLALILLDVGRVFCHVRCVVFLEIIAF